MTRECSWKEPGAWVAGEDQVASIAPTTETRRLSDGGAMHLATKRKLVLYLTPLFVACLRVREWWSFPDALVYRSTARYVEALLTPFLVLLGLWFLYYFVILMTAFIVVYASERLGWMGPAPQKTVSDEMHGIITLTWLVIKLGGWLGQYWPAGNSDWD
jgi:hypothetical protein